MTSESTPDVYTAQDVDGGIDNELKSADLERPPSTKAED
jgi:hypothetical protein